MSLAALIRVFRPRWASAFFDTNLRGYSRHLGDGGLGEGREQREGCPERVGFGAPLSHVTRDSPPPTSAVGLQAEILPAAGPSV